MALTILTSTHRYLDFGALYLTEQQMKASFLELRVNIIAIQSPVSMSFRRNPPQSVYGYLTTCYQECVYDEIECRFDYQSLYRYVDNYQLLAQLDCIYYGAIAANQNSIASSNTTQGPYSILQVDGLTTVIRRPLDSFRFRAINPCVFDFILYWSYDDTDYGTCGIEIIDLPEPSEPSSNAPGYDPARNSDPNSAQAIESPSKPTSSEATIVPEDAPGTDFSDRNETEQPPLYPPETQGRWDIVLKYKLSPSSPEQTYTLDDVQGIYIPAPIYGFGAGGLSVTVFGLYGPIDFAVNGSPFTSDPVTSFVRTFTPL